MDSLSVASGFSRKDAWSVRNSSTATSFRLKPEATQLVVSAFIGLAAILVLSGAAIKQVAASEPRYTEVYTRGEKGYDTFRIPSVIATSRGTLLAIAEGRREGAGDAGDID